MSTARKTPNTIKRYAKTFYVDDDGDDVSDVLIHYHYYYDPFYSSFIFCFLVTLKVIIQKIYENS